VPIILSINGAETFGFEDQGSGVLLTTIFQKQNDLYAYHLYK